MYGMKITEQIDAQLPILLEFVRIMSKRDRGYIPQLIASASTILYAVQEGFISRDGETFELTDAGLKMWDKVTA